MVGTAAKGIPQAMEDPLGPGVQQQEATGVLQG